MKLRTPTTTDAPLIFIVVFFLANHVQQNGCPRFWWNRKFDIDWGDHRSFSQMTTQLKFLCHFCFFSLSYIYGSWLHYLQDSCSMIFQGEGIRIWKCRRCQDLVSGQIIAAAKSISTKLITHIDVKKPYKLCFLMKLCEHIFKRQTDLFVRFEREE